jgi:hypothetical protein
MVALAVRYDPAAVRIGLRRLLWGRGIAALGDGLWFTIWAVYFTRILGLSGALVGIGLAAGGAAGLAAAVPLGALADRCSPRRLLVAVTVVRAAAMAGYLLVHGPAPFLAVTVAFAALANGGNAVRTALVAGLVEDNAGRLRTLARQRVAQHVGYALGAGLGAAVLAADRPAAYQLAIAGNAASFLALAALTATLPAPPARARRSASRLALADRPYLAVVGATAVLSLCWAMLSTGLPIWISRSTSLPLSLSAAVVVISSVGIAAFQVPVTGLVRTTADAARTAVRAGLALAASCVLLAGTTTVAAGAGGVAVALVLAAALLHVAGELGYVAASWGLSVTLMREQARGAYQGVLEAATATVQIAGPAVFTFALGSFGAAGWLLVGAVFVAAASPVPTLARRAATRHRAAPVPA